MLQNVFKPLSNVQMSAAVTLYRNLAYILEDISSNLSRFPGYAGWHFAISDPSRRMMVWYFKIGHDSLIPNYFIYYR
jgi:hypothetical protein